ncbi:MAG TPA: DNA translocase FtsK 4TM domain-containing protein, partial [Sphingomonadales bacterium]|nr:DNA translocase FtsK 4TM domain-containing protein [Sphingomonadales bacterium]
MGRVKIGGTAPILPPKAAAWLGRTARRIAGAGLFALFALLALALISFNRLDPALNTDSGLPPENWLGLPGAFAADLLLQTLGLVSVGLLFILLGWAWRIGSLKGLANGWVRLAAIPVSLSLLSAAFAALPRGEGWPFETGLGGLLGHQLYGVFSFAFGIFPEGSVRELAGIAVFGALAATPFFYALALDRNDWRALARGIVRGVIFAGALIGKTLGLAGRVAGAGTQKLVRRRLQRTEP